jgi:MFS family permease
MWIRCGYSIESPPMRRAFFYGWIVVGAAFVSHFLSYGTQVVAFGLFLPAMADGLHVSRAALSGTFGLARLVSAAVAPAFGVLVDRRGPRLLIVLGTLSLAGGAVMLAAARSGWHVVMGYAVLMAVGGVALGELSADATVTRWFVRRRGRALAVATMGLSTAGIVIPLPLAYAITQLGWRGAWVAIAIAVLALGTVAAVAMRARPEDHGLVADGAVATEAPPEAAFTARQAVRLPAFWLLVIGTNLGGLALFGVNVHLYSYLGDRGVPPATAAAVVTLLYVLHTAAKPLWGVIAERVHVRYCIAACYAGGGIGILILLTSSHFAAVLAFTVVYGLTRGAQSFITSLAWANYFGREAQGAIRGLAAPARFIASAAGPVLGGWLYDATGSYTQALLAFALAFLLGGLVASAARAPETAPLRD